MPVVEQKHISWQKNTSVLGNGYVNACRLSQEMSRLSSLYFPVFQSKINKVSLLNGGVVTLRHNVGGVAGDRKAVSSSSMVHKQRQCGRIATQSAERVSTAESLAAHVSLSVSVQISLWSTTLLVSGHLCDTCMACTGIYTSFSFRFAHPC